MGFSKRFDMDIDGNAVEFLMFMEEEDDCVNINQMVGVNDMQLISSVRMNKLKLDTNGDEIESNLGTTIYDMISDIEENTAKKYALHLIRAYANGEID